MVTVIWGLDAAYGKRLLCWYHNYVGTSVPEAFLYIINQTCREHLRGPVQMKKRVLNDICLQPIIGTPFTSAQIAGSGADIQGSEP